MALKIAPDFDVNTQALDTNETFIRDNLKLQIVSWAKFRHTINIGNNASNLYSLAGPIPNDVQDAYRELAKSHYEAILSLGSAKLSLIFAANAPNLQIGNRPSLLTFQKSMKEFYFHLGCLLDNLARLIYILNDPDAAIAKDRRGRFIRHRIDWGDLCRRVESAPGLFRSYRRLTRSIVVDEILNIRNGFTHGWSCPINIATGVPFWPVALRSKRDYYWPYDEAPKMRTRYKKWVPVMQMAENDFAYMERFQNQIFAKLINSVATFEKTHKLVIR
ncbi:MAG TPA: hypothetical protein VJL59_01620 [Anaerolineales bacterium]|nr:hypothetical protein [Anaerolineales bacterium]